MSRAEVGRWAEDQALAYLEAQGLRCITRNYRCRLGELDLIVTDGAALIVVEVRLRNNDRFGDGAASVTAAKQRRIVRATGLFLQHQPRWRRAPLRFDVLSVVQRDCGPSVQWIRDAFRC